MEQLQVWTLVFSFAVAQGIFITLLLLIRRKETYLPNIFLASLVLVYSISVAFYIVYWNDLHKKYVHLNYILSPLIFLYGPLVFLYIKTLVEKRISKTSYLHFVPFLLVVLLFSPFYILSTQGKIDFFVNKEYLQFPWRIYKVLLNISIIGSLFFYSFKNFHYLKSKEQLFNNQLTEGVWLKRIAIFFALFSVLYLSYFVLIEGLGWSKTTDYVIALLMSGFIYSIGIMGFYKPELFRKKEIILIEKYKHSTLKTEQAKTLLLQLTMYMEKEKPYLKEDLKLPIFAKQIGIPAHHISELLNQYQNTSFSDFVNSYRIEAAKKLLLSTDFETKTISGIGYDVGFKSRTTFYKAFKKITQLSPKAYRDKVLKVS